MDSAELSFVRCPACRSLVPAASNRCRMCGSSLEGLTQSEQAAKEEPKNGRVRQHTSVDDDAGVSQAIEKVRTEAAEAPKAPQEVAPTPPPVMAPPYQAPQASAPQVEASAADEDPLKAYLEDFNDEDEDTDDDEDLKDLLSDDDDDSDEPAPIPEVKAHATKPEAPKQEEPKVVVEQGMQRKSGGLSFGNKAETPAAPKPQAPKVEAKPAPSKPAASKPAPQAAAPAPKPQQRVAAEPPKRKERAEKPAEGAPARLIGWLVSFASPEGASLELREGRFFVTSTNVRRGDLVLHDDSVSSPHAMVNVGSRTGVTVQDLMSEQGLFVRRAGEQNFFQEHETAELFHGDVVRFGEVEFLVCLVPDGNA